MKDIVRSAGGYPDKNAFVIDGTTYSYGDLFAFVNGIHSFLAGAEEGIIGIVAENRVETYASILAVLLSGKTYVILHPHYPDNRNNKIREAGDIRVILYAGECRMAESMPDDVSFICTRELRGERKAEYCYGEEDTKAYIVFTSGSTGGTERGADYPAEPECFLLGLFSLGLEAGDGRPDVADVRVDV